MWRVVEGRASSSGGSLTFYASFAVNNKGRSRLLIVDKKEKKKAISKVLMGTDLVARRAKEERRSARTFP